MLSSSSPTRASSTQGRITTRSFQASNSSAESSTILTFNVAPRPWRSHSLPNQEKGKATSICASFPRPVHAQEKPSGSRTREYIFKAMLSTDRGDRRGDGGCDPVGVRLEPACHTSERKSNTTATQTPNRRGVAGGIKRRYPGPTDHVSDGLGSECSSGPFLSPVQREPRSLPFPEGGSRCLNSSIPQLNVPDLHSISSSGDALQYVHDRHLVPHRGTRAVTSSPTEEDLYKYNSSVNHLPPTSAASRAPSDPDDCNVGRASFRGRLRRIWRWEIWNRREPRHYGEGNGKSLADNSENRLGSIGEKFGRAFRLFQLWRIQTVPSCLPTRRTRDVVKSTGCRDSDNHHERGAPNVPPLPEGLFATGNKAQNQAQRPNQYAKRQSPGIVVL